jgi:hypothetical protein
MELLLAPDLAERTLFDCLQRGALAAHVIAQSSLSRTFQVKEFSLF